MTPTSHGRRPTKPPSWPAMPVFGSPWLQGNRIKSFTTGDTEEHRGWQIPGESLCPLWFKILRHRRAIPGLLATLHNQIEISARAGVFETGFFCENKQVRSSCLVFKI